MSDGKGNSKFESALDGLRRLTGDGLKVAVVIVLAVVAWRLAWAGFSVDLSKFDFSDLLAMILALFAIAMAVAFYFKTTDSSNQFYDNIYNFTQKTSEILGRIEERFGERLKHLDEGYFKMQSRFDSFSKSPNELLHKGKETAGQEEVEKGKLREANEEMQKLMNELYEKAKMQETQREEFNARLQQLTRERAAAQERIKEMEADRDRMQMQLSRVEHDMMLGMEGLPPDVIEHLLHHPEMRELIMTDASPEILRRHSRRFFMDLPDEITKRLREAGVVDPRGQITPAGALMLRSLGRRYLR